MQMMIRFPFFAAFIIVLLAGNGFALYKLFTEKDVFLSKFPRLTEKAIFVFRFLPLLNIIALAGLWFFKSWGAYLAVACALAVIFFDVYYAIWYHLVPAIASTGLLLFFLVKYWDKIN